MKIAYLISATPPAIEGTDAVIQEAEMLRARFGGELVYLVPGTRPKPWLPRALYGIHCWPTLRRLDREVDVHHVYHAQLYLFPVLHLLSKPVVYTVLSGLGTGAIPPARRLDRLEAIAVPSQQDLDRLERRGVRRARAAPAGVDASRFAFTPIEAGDELVLLVGSAPWTRGQFSGKGIDALLEVVRQTPWLRLVFLWRGRLLEELCRRIDALGLSGRTEIVTERTDVNEVLGRVHGAVVLARAPELVKAYPHSLIEALLCGRPVLVSDCLAMADYVGENGCGRVVRGVSPSDLRLQVHRLREGYDRYQAEAHRVGRRDFSWDRVVSAYRAIYEAASAPASREGT